MIYWMDCLGSDGISCKSAWSSGNSGNGAASGNGGSRVGREAGPGPGMVHDETASAILGGNQKSHESHSLNNNEEDSDNKAVALGFKGRGLGDGNSIGGNRGLFIHKLKPSASQSISSNSLVSYSAVSPYLPPYPLDELKLWEPPRKSSRSKRFSDDLASLSFDHPLTSLIFFPMTNHSRVTKKSKSLAGGKWARSFHTKGTRSLKK